METLHFTPYEQELLKQRHMTTLRSADFRVVNLAGVRNLNQVIADAQYHAVTGELI